SPTTDKGNIDVTSDNSPRSLTELLKDAVSKTPSHSTLVEFYRQFLSSDLLVAERQQLRDLSSGAAYPSDFTSVLGVLSGEETFIPAFCEHSDVSDWFSDELNVIRISGKELCKRAPQGWWITLNPGSDYGKEFSPWEITRLKEGDPGIEEIVADHEATPALPLEFRYLSQMELESLQEKLCDKLKEVNGLLEFYVGKKLLDKEEMLVFAAIQSTDRGDSLYEEIHSILSLALIGDVAFEVFVGYSLRDSAELALFQYVPPFYSSTLSKVQDFKNMKISQNLIQRILAPLRKLLK
ncbi:MAG: SseB family protein, partial [Bdellovibrionales bacterium]|nr:SseB family protein [Bdellovibrionales bacterium]